MDRPFSAACERNRGPILAALREWFADRRAVLEIGSGTGQHAVHFAAAMPHLRWQCSDRAEQLPGIRLWLDEAALPNTPPPLELDVGGTWPRGPYDAAFSANTLHIMAWEGVARMFERLAGALVPGGLLAVYGPFHRDGRPTSPSNAAFDARLRAQAAHMGVRDAAAVDALARLHGFALQRELAMPAHNLLRLWRLGAR